MVQKFAIKGIGNPRDSFLFDATGFMRLRATAGLLVVRCHDPRRHEGAGVKGTCRVTAPARPGALSGREPAVSRA